MQGKIISVFLVLLCVHFSFQIGTLYVNEIWGNQDYDRFRIEDTVIDDTTMLTDFIDGLVRDRTVDDDDDNYLTGYHLFDNDADYNNGVGVFIEGTMFIAGDVNVPGFQHVHHFANYNGALHANGGIRCDAGPEFPGESSFTVADNTGDTTIRGMLSPFGGINSDNCLFTVHNITGETRITSALLHPLGGIEVGDALYTVSDDDGSVRTKGDGIVNLDFTIGPNSPDLIAYDILVSRVASATEFGGNTIIKGQDAASEGGNLLIVAGKGDTVALNGQIYWGRRRNDDLYIGRSGLDAYAMDGGDTIIAGQDAYIGKGGDLYFTPGRTSRDYSVASSHGGDLLLDVGLSSDNGFPGRIILGDDESGISNFDLLVRRPFTPTTTSGQETYYTGQSCTATDCLGGDFYIRAGDVRSGSSGRGGDLILKPGLGTTASEFTQGFLILGSSVRDADLTIRREPVYEPAGDTYIVGQDARQTSGGPYHGGDVYFVTGAGLGNNIEGGDFWIMPGTTESGTPGKIIWGNDHKYLQVTTPDNNNVITPNAASTTINGQTSDFASGGDLNFSGGKGNLAGGDLQIYSGLAGAGSTTSGDITLKANAGTIGGSVLMNGGFGTEDKGGDISFSTGSSGNTGNTLTVNAGAGSTKGNIIVGPAASAFYIDRIPAIIEKQTLNIQKGDDILTLNAVATNILNFNGRQLLAVPTVTIPTLNVANIIDQTTVYDVVNNMSDTLNAIVCQIGHTHHGLVTIVDTTDQLITDPCLNVAP